MGRREADIAQFAQLVPRLLDHIKRQSGVRHAELYRRLAVRLDLTPESVKRNWLRWRAVTDQVGERGRLAHSTSLKRLVDAASDLGWLHDAHESDCAPLLKYLHAVDKRRYLDSVRSARRRMGSVRRLVREVIGERRWTAFDDVTWMSAMFEVVGDEIARELRQRLIEGAEDSDNPSVELADELLSGTISQKIRAVLDSGTRAMHRANAAIWARTAERIIPEFERATGATLGAGIKLLVRTRPVYKPQFGFSLEIDAIDPTYTLGDLEAKKRELRQRLKREQLFDLNKRLPAPWDFSTVLVVAPQGGAGLGDFSKEADRLAQFAVCHFTYVHSRFQGEGAAAEILEALTDGLTQFPDGQSPDAVILIRGGGAVNDLAWLNDYSLARFICECPVPVLTGIGHERDSTVLDEVAHTSFDTPSKVVAGIEQLIIRRTREALAAFEVIVNQGRRDVDRVLTSVERLDREVEATASATIADARARCSQLMADLRHHSVRVVHRAAGEVQELFGVVRTGATAHVAQAKHGVPAAMNAVKAEAFSALRTAKVQLDATLPALFDRAGLDVRRFQAAADVEFGSVIDRSRQTIRDASTGAQALFREIAGQGPQKTLGRGFAIVRGADGKTLTSAESAASAESIEVAFRDGKIDAAVRDVKLESSDEVLGNLDTGGK